MGKQVKKVKTKRVSYTQLRDVNHLMLPIWTHGGQYHPAPAGMPTEVKMYGQAFRVLYHSRIYAEKKVAARLLGVIIFNYRVIILEPNQTIHMMRQALYHEMGHFYLETARSKSESLRKLTHQQIEDICDMLGEAVPDLVGNNTVST